LDIRARQQLLIRAECLGHLMRLGPGLRLLQVATGDSLCTPQQVKCRVCSRVSRSTSTYQQGGSAGSLDGFRNFGRNESRGHDAPREA
jgi:hypothetical protein